MNESHDQPGSVHLGFVVEVVEGDALTYEADVLAGLEVAHEAIKKTIPLC